MSWEARGLIPMSRGLVVFSMEVCGSSLKSVVLGVLNSESGVPLPPSHYHSRRRRRCACTPSLWLPPQGRLPGLPPPCSYSSVQFSEQCLVCRVQCLVYSIQYTV